MQNNVDVLVFLLVLVSIRKARITTALLSGMQQNVELNEGLRMHGLR